MCVADHLILSGLKNLQRSYLARRCVFRSVRLAVAGTALGKEKNKNAVCAVDLPLPLPLAHTSSQHNGIKSQRGHNSRDAPLPSRQRSAPDACNERRTHAQYTKHIRASNTRVRQTQNHSHAGRMVTGVRETCTIGWFVLLCQVVEEGVTALPHSIRRCYAGLRNLFDCRCTPSSGPCSRSVSWNENYCSTQIRTHLAERTAAAFGTLQLPPL